MATQPTTPKKTEANSFTALSALQKLKAPERHAALTAIAVQHPEIVMAVVTEVLANR